MNIIRKYIRSILLEESLLLEGRGDFVFMSAFKLILTAAGNGEGFVYESGLLKDVHQKIGHTGKQPYWRPYQSREAVAGGYFDVNDGKLKTVAERIYNELVSKHGESATKHWGNSPALVWLLMTKLAFWTYSFPSRKGAGGVAAGVWRTGRNNRSKKTPWGFGNMGIYNQNNLSINTGTNKGMRIGKMSRKAWADDQLDGMGTIYSHEYRHAYQTLFILPPKLKKVFVTAGEEIANAKEHWSEQRSRAVSVKVNMKLPPNIINIFNNIFSQEETRIPSKGKGKNLITFVPGKAYHVLIKSPGTKGGKGKWRTYVAQKILNYIINKVDLDQDDKETDVAIGMLRTMLDPHMAKKDPDYRSSRESKAYDLNMVLDDKQKEIVSLFANSGKKKKWQKEKKINGFHSNTFLYDIVEIPDSKKYIARGARMFYIVPNPEKKNLIPNDKSKWPRKKTRRGWKNDRQNEFDDLRGLDKLDSHINLTDSPGEPKNSGQKWSNQPTEFDAELSSELYRFISARMAKNKYLQHKIIGIIVDDVRDIRGIKEELKDYLYSYMISNLNRFFTGDTPADLRHQKVYVKSLSNRLNQVVNKIVMWFEDNWDDTLDYSPNNSQNKKYAGLFKKLIDDLI